jgi:integrase
MDYESFYRNRFRPAAVRIGQPELRFHDLPHTSASLFAASGMPLARVAQVLGHSDTATTYKVYLHFFPDDTQPRWTGWTLTSTGARAAVQRPHQPRSSGRKANSNGRG